MMKKKILELDKKHIWHPFTQKKNCEDPIVIVSGKDEKVFDIDGNEYLDLISSWWVNTHGHARAELIKDLNLQAKKIEQILFAGFTHEPATSLAEKLIKLLPNKLSRVFYSDNGSTAVEVALKVAIQYWYNRGKRKTKFLAFKGGYHGDTFGAMSVGYSSGFYGPFKDLTLDTTFIPFPETWEGDNKKYEKEKESLKFVEEILNDSPDEIAAVIIEPIIQGASGMKMCDPLFLDKVLKRFKEKNIIIIFDEVMTGFGRTGKMFAMEHIITKPDIVCIAKSLTAGYIPLAATIFSESIHNEFVDTDFKKTFLHGHSFTANPLGCSVAIASLKIFEKNNVLNKVSQIEKIHKKGLDFLKSNIKVSKTRLIGSIAAFDLIGTDRKYGSKIGIKIREQFLKKGLLIRPIGNTIYLMPPYCIDNKTLENVYSILDAELKNI